ncbi:MAG: SDR family oxidoreductase [Verrucomicrobia bacterium]|nr:SDR family oxidoreductase [Verrucomicrobiota bacterium]
MRVLVIGCGYVGAPLAARLQAQGHAVLGLRRTEGPHDDLRRAEVTPLVADITSAESLQASLEGLRFDWVVNATSSRGGGAEGYERLYLRGTQRVMDWLKRTPPRCYVHLSSTSVYGQVGGEAVTEESPTLPVNDTSRVLVAAEQWLLNPANTHGARTAILRCAGIYGPERGHLFLKFIRGEATMTGEGDRWLNMIHRDDVVSGVLAVLNDPAANGAINVADDEPVQERDFYGWLSRELGRPLPPSADPGDRVRKRGDTNKRVMNTRLKQHGLPELQFPNYRAGYSVEIKRLGLSR